RAAQSIVPAVTLIHPYLFVKLPHPYRRDLPRVPTRRSADLARAPVAGLHPAAVPPPAAHARAAGRGPRRGRGHRRGHGHGAPGRAPAAGRRQRGQPQGDHPGRPGLLPFPAPVKARLVAVGERAPAWVAEGFAEYRKRLSHWLPLELVEVAPGVRGKGRDPARAMAEEGARVLAALPKNARVVVL